MSQSLKKYQQSQVHLIIGDFILDESVQETEKCDVDTFNELM